MATTETRWEPGERVTVRVAGVAREATVERYDADNRRYIVAVGGRRFWVSTVSVADSLHTIPHVGQELPTTEETQAPFEVGRRVWVVDSAAIEWWEGLVVHANYLIRVAHIRPLNSPHPDTYAVPFDQLRPSSARPPGPTGTTVYTSGNVNDSAGYPVVYDNRDNNYAADEATAEQLRRVEESVRATRDSPLMSYPIRRDVQISLTPDTEALLAVLLRPRTPAEAAWCDVLCAIISGDDRNRLAAAAVLADLVKQELEG